MLTIIGCSECGKSGGFSYKLQWEYMRKTCDKCQETTVTNKKYYLCDNKCLSLFVKKLSFHKHNWKPHPYLGVLYVKGKPTRKWQVCGICNIIRDIGVEKK